MIKLISLLSEEIVQVKFRDVEEATKIMSIMRNAIFPKLGIGDSTKLENILSKLVAVTHDDLLEYGFIQVFQQNGYKIDDPKIIEFQKDLKVKNFKSTTGGKMATFAEGNIGAITVKVVIDKLWIPSWEKSIAFNKKYPGSADLTYGEWKDHFNKLKAKKSTIDPKYAPMKSTGDIESDIGPQGK